MEFKLHEKKKDALMKFLISELSNFSKLLKKLECDDGKQVYLKWKKEVAKHFFFNLVTNTSGSINWIRNP